ncbi:YdcF family protein [Oculatella sp. LEGE 06141]|uniref:YdcF family protein n=1 Tax=Oculatella sp. LEGE 06141 TaxID=1828648 RepID=UPI00187F840C|nr:YdcF family protein [Oculatella sp. LEGE 06141]MBE9179529.1 YdcF family protein [Oculatella sp. LEGE 06141]
MKRLRRRFRGTELLRFAILGVLIGWISIIPVRLAIASHQSPHPEGIFILGGDPSREAAAATIAKYYPTLDIWVSGSSETPERAKAIFRAAGVAVERLTLDYAASDTVTNFTTLVPEFKQRNLRHLYLVTSDFHMSRAKAIATIVLGSQGITFTPVSVPSNEEKESTLRIVRDICRSFLWLITGQTGATLGESLIQKLAHLQVRGL